MNLNKIGKVLLTIFGGVMVFLVISLFLEDSYYGNLPQLIQMLILLGSVLTISLSVALIFYNSSTEKRKKAIKIISIVTGTIFVLGWFFKIMHWPGASALVIISSFMFSFGGLPLIIKGRYENRRTLLSNAVNLLSFADLLSVILILMGGLFRIMHWVGANYVFITGVVILAITFIFWNLSFRKEVKLRMEAEEKLKESLHEIEEKQKEIRDSINYAKRIQEAIMPSPDFIKSNLPDSFIFYQPKDVVAGDFYWAEKVGDDFFIAVADCTGHGVPGALVSVVCCNALNRTLNEFNLSDPGEILDKTRELVTQSFSKSTDDIKDGMDISLMKINSKKVEWAGANNPLWIVSKNENESGKSELILKEIKADKQPIGRTHHPKPFTTHLVELKKGDSIYLFTDGFTDQFGGPRGKKFMYKQLKDLLVANYQLTFQEQAPFLREVLNTWKGTLDQVDDVCIIGIRL
jgi:serine phosphatase RsbU (regulator of sigma subunit)